ITYDAPRLGFDLHVAQQQGRNGQLTGAVDIHPDRREAQIHELAVALGRAPWRLANGDPERVALQQADAGQPDGARPLDGRPRVPTLSWNDEGFAVTPIAFTDPNNDQRIGVAGSWRRDGNGALHVTASHVFLDTLQTAFERPTRYGGALDLDATIGG